MASSIAAYLLILIYLGADARLRKGAKARSLAPGGADRQSTRAISVAIVTSITCLLLAPLLNYFHLSWLGSGWFPGWVGVALMGLGLGLRWWAMRVLGRFYTRTLLTAADQRIVQDGPYRRVRHPGYSGTLLIWIGAGLAVSNGWVLAVIALACGASYGYRIHVEEGMLVETFGQEYTDYMRGTKRLIPFVY